MSGQPHDGGKLIVRKWLLRCPASFFPFQVVGVQRWGRDGASLDIVARLAGVTVIWHQCFRNLCFGDDFPFEREEVVHGRAVGLLDEKNPARDGVAVVV